MSLKPGQVVDRYTVERLLGQGGMAEVYLVRHNTLNSPHALKVLSHAGPAVHGRLIQEGRVQANLRHPNIVAVTDVLEVAGAPALVMEFIDGSSLEEWLQAHEPTLEQALYIFHAILNGVERAHEEGVAHRDLKPANVMITASGIPKVTDFGLAKALLNEEAGHTRTGTAMGTPAYMAPEQIRNAKDTDHRADLFALGCILYELVCHRQAFTAPDLLSLFNKVAAGDTLDPELIRPDLPPELLSAIRGAMVVDRRDRIPNIHAMREVLHGERPWAAPTLVLHADGRASSEVAAPHRPPSPSNPPPDSAMSFGELDLPEAEEAPGPPWGRIALGVGMGLLGIGLLAVLGTSVLSLAAWTQLRPTEVVEAVEAVEVPVEAPEEAPVQVEEGSQQAPPTEPEPPKSARTQPKTQPVAKSDRTTTPSVPTGTVKLVGADSIILSRGSERYGPGPVPAGTYTITASWDGHASGAGSVTVKSGATVTVRCDPDFLTCEAG